MFSKKLAYLYSKQLKNLVLLKYLRDTPIEQFMWLSVQLHHLLGIHTSLNT